MYLYLVLTLQCGHKIKPLITVVAGLECLKYFITWPQAKQFPDIAYFEACSSRVEKVGKSRKKYRRIEESGGDGGNSEPQLTGPKS